MRRRLMDLIGTFEEELYAGELMHLYVFRDLSFGNYPVGVKKRHEFFNDIELGQICHIKVEVRNHKKPLMDGSISWRVALDAITLENLKMLPGSE